MGGQGSKFRRQGSRCQRSWASKEMNPLSTIYCDLIKCKTKSNNLTTPHPHQPCYQPSHSQMNNLFDLRPKMQMGHGPIGAVKFQAAFIKQALGCTWARDVLRLTGFIWAGTGHNQVWGAARWAPHHGPEQSRM